MEEQIQETPIERKKRLARERQRRFRNKMTDEEKEQMRKKNFERQKLYIENMSDEKRKQLKLRNKINVKLKREKLRNTNEEEMKRLARESAKKYRTKMRSVNEEKLKRLARENARKYREKKRNLNEEEVKMLARQNARKYREKMKALNEEDLKKTAREYSKNYRQKMNSKSQELKEWNFHENCNGVNLSLMKTKQSLYENMTDKLEIKEYTSEKMTSEIQSEDENVLEGQSCEYNNMLDDVLSKSITYYNNDSNSDKEVEDNYTNSHTDDKVRQCSACGTILSNYDSLIKHMKSLHSEDYEMIEKLRINVHTIQNLMTLKDIKFIKDKNTHKEPKSSMEENNDLKLFKSETIICNSLQGGKAICYQCGLILSCREQLECHSKAKHEDKSIVQLPKQDLKDENIQCPICNENFNIKKLLCHINAKHFLKSNSSFKCDDCGLVFISEEFLTSHYNVSTDKIYSLNANVFDMYNFSYINNDNYQGKCSEQDNNKLDGSNEPNTTNKLIKLYRCKLCNYVHRYSFLVLKHVIKTHLNIFHCPFECPFCFLKSKRYSIKKHIKFKHPDANANPYFVCEVCGYISLHEGSFKIHIRNHTKKYNCEYCNYTTSLSSSIHIHRRKHTKHKPYKCDFEECHYECSQKTSLTSHRFTHYPEKYLQSCEVCGFRTVNKYIMNSHLKDHSKGPKIFSCFQCSYSTNIKSQLVGHSIVHKEASQCTMCDFATKYKQIMKKHMESKHGVMFTSKWHKEKTNLENNVGN